MAIDPTKSSGVHPIPGSRVDQTGSNQASRQSGQLRGASPEEAREAPDQDDQVQLSAEARAASQPDAPSPSTSGLDQERMRELLKRLTSGYYDSPQVTDQVARKLVDELNGLTGPE